MKKLDIFKKSIILSDILNLFKDEKIFVEISGLSGLDASFEGDIPLELLIDEEESDDLGFFLGDNCQRTLSSKSTCKIIDKDSIKIIDSDEKRNIGLILRFKSLKPLNLF
jgi:hypothetical protein